LLGIVIKIFIIVSFKLIVLLFNGVVNTVDDRSYNFVDGGFNNWEPWFDSEVVNNGGSIEAFVPAPNKKYLLSTVKVWNVFGQAIVVLFDQVIEYPEQQPVLV